MKRINEKRFLSVVFVSAILFLTFTAFPLTAAEAKTGKSIGAIEKIQADYKAQKITLDEYILNKAWAVFKPEKLSGTKYALSFEDRNTRFGKSGTAVILEIKKNWNKLSSNTQDQLGWVFLRPPDVGGGADYEQHLLPQLTVSGGGNFTIHWTNGSDGGNAADAPASTDVSPANGIPDYIDNIASVFDNVRTFEVTGRGFNAPPSDAAEPNDAYNRNPDATYDIFIYRLPDGVLGYADPEQHPSRSSYSYIVINSYLLGIAYLAQQCPAHEFFHAIQFYYDCTEDLWWMETTAQYMAFEVYPVPSPAYYNFWWFSDWFDYCDWYGLTYPDWHMYGNFHWAKRLSEDFTDDVIREIWEECQITNGLAAIDHVLDIHHGGSSVVEEFKEFTKANFFLEDMYVDGDDYRTALTGNTDFDGVWLEYEYDAVTEGLPFTIDEDNVNIDAWMDTWATDYVTLTLDPAVANYWVYFDGLDNTTDYSVNLVTKKGAVITDHIFSLDAQKDGYVELAYDTYDDVVLIIMNAGDTTTTDPSWVVLLTTEGSVLFDRDSYSAPDVANVTVFNSDLDITENPDSVDVEFTSDTEVGSEVVTLTETGDSTGVFTGSIDLVLVDAVGKLHVQHADIITVTYDNGGTPETDTAIISLISAPTGLMATAGQTYVFLRWNPVSSSVLAGYNVYRSTSLAGAKTKVNGTLVTNNYYQNIYLPSGTTYYYWVTAVDIYDIDTDYSNVVKVTTGEESGGGIIVPDGGGDDGNGGGGGSGGGIGSLSGCFVATACYGTPMAEEVRILSNFRDEYLLTNSLGRFFVGNYYKFSPQLAEYISQHPVLKKFVRIGLKPLVHFSEKLVSEK